MADDNRKLWERAIEHMGKGRFDKAAEAYAQLCAANPGDLTFRQRLGDAQRQAGRLSEAVATYRAVADRMAAEGALLKAIAVNKVILEIDPNHQVTQARLAALNAKRDASNQAKATPFSSVASRPAVQSVAPRPVVQTGGVEAIELPDDDAPLELDRPWAAAFHVTAAPPEPAPALDLVAAQPEAELPAAAEAPFDAEPEALAVEAVPMLHPAPTAEAAYDPEAGGDAHSAEAVHLPEIQRAALPQAAAAVYAPPEYQAPVLRPRSKPVAVEVEAPPTLEPAGETPWAPEAAPEAVPASQLAQAPEIQPAPLPETAAEVQEPPPERDAPVLRARPMQFPKTPLFGDMDPGAFVELLQRCSLRHFRSGEPIIHQGDPGDSFFIISSGTVMVRRKERSGQTFDLARLREGAFFGEMALLGGGPRSASAVADGDVALLEFPAEVLGELMAEHVSARQAVERFTRNRLLATVMATSPLFRPFDAENRRRLIERFQVGEVVAGQTVLEEGTPGDGLYVVMLGRFQVRRRREGAEPLFLSELHQGDLFGEISLLTGSNTTADVVAVEPGRLLRLPRQLFEELILSHPQVLELVSRLSEERIQVLEETLAGAAPVDTEGLSFI